MKASLAHDLDVSLSEDGVLARESASGAGDPLWARFEAEALPHTDRLFRLAMWLERDRSEAEDLVQETMLAAHCDFAKFRGSTERELLAWLRQILINCLHHAIETHLNARMRDVRREISVEQVSAALDRSVVHFAQVLADRGPSPSAPLRERERAVALADQLAKLRPAYRDVIVLRNLQGLSFDEVPDRMDRKPGTVRMLWLRAIDKFKQVYDPIL